MKRLSTVFLSFFFLAAPVNAETVKERFYTRFESFRSECDNKEFKKIFPRRMFKNKKSYNDFAFVTCRGIGLATLSGMMTGVCIAEDPSPEFINKCIDASEDFLSLPYNDTLNGDNPFELYRVVESFHHYIKNYLP